MQARRSGKSKVHGHLGKRFRLNNDINIWIDRHAQMNFVELRQGIPFLIHNSPIKTGQSQKEISNSTGIVRLSSEDKRLLRLQKRNSRYSHEQKPPTTKKLLGRAIKLDET